MHGRFILGNGAISRRSSSADPSRCSSLFSGRALTFYFIFPYSRQLILSPSSLLFSIPFITKVHIHGSAKPLNRTIFLVCRFSSACVVRCKFARIRSVTLGYSMTLFLERINLFSCNFICMNECTY